LTFDMPRTRWPFLRHETNRHGQRCWYFRRENGKRIRLRGEYGSDRFKREYQAALQGREISVEHGPEAGTVAWLVNRYKESLHYASLKKSTRRQRDSVLMGLANSSAGAKPFTHIMKAHIEDAMGRRASTPSAANNFLIIVSKMFDWAVSADKLKTNPCRGVKPFKIESGGFHTWSVDEVEQFRRRHKVGTKARLALDLLLFIGLRRSDVIRLGRQHVKDGVASIQTVKTGTWVHIPIFPELQRSIDATKTGDLTFLTSATGMPFASSGSFGNWFRARCDEAGMPKECASHGLRKAGATLAANAGATAHELMAMYGWSRLKMAEVYTKEADKARLARGAAKRIAEAIPPHLKQG
jgi:integrase